MWVHPWGANCCPHGWEANGWPAGPVRLWTGVRNMGAPQYINIYTHTYIDALHYPRNSTRIQKALKEHSFFRGSEWPEIIHLFCGIRMRWTFNTPTFKENIYICICDGCEFLTCWHAVFLSSWKYILTPRPRQTTGFLLIVQYNCSAWKTADKRLA